MEKQYALQHSHGQYLAAAQVRYRYLRAGLGHGPGTLYRGGRPYPRGRHRQRQRPLRDIPVDLTINQYDPASWRNVIAHIGTHAREDEDPTVVLLQHEYGLDPDEQGRPARGRHYVEMARAFQEKN